MCHWESSEPQIIVTLFHLVAVSKCRRTRRRLELSPGSIKPASPPLAPGTPPFLQTSSMPRRMTAPSLDTSEFLLWAGGSLCPGCFTGQCLPAGFRKSQNPVRRLSACFCPSPSLFMQGLNVKERKIHAFKVNKAI